MARIARFILLIAGAMAAVAPAAANDWKPYRYPNEGFAVEFPGVPRTTVMDVPVKQFVRGVQYLATDDAGTEYLGQALLYQQAIRKNNTTDKILRVSIDGAKDAGKCSIRSERNYSFPGAFAREVVFEKCEGTAGKSRVLLLGDWLYFILSIGRPGVETSADADRFISSFSVIGPPSRTSTRNVPTTSSRRTVRIGYVLVGHVTQPLSAAAAGRVRVAATTAPMNIDFARCCIARALLEARSSIPNLQIGCSH